jgi:hypothetical protein
MILLDFESPIVLPVVFSNGTWGAQQALTVSSAEEQRLRLRGDLRNAFSGFSMRWASCAGVGSLVLILWDEDVESCELVAFFSVIDDIISAAGPRTYG